jgi:multidrug resistance efflux pump
MDQQTERALGDAVENIGAEAPDAARSSSRQAAAASLPTRRGPSLSRRRRLALVVGGVLGAVACCEIATRFVAYTDDLVGVAPQVTGRIIAVHVVDNQAIHGGDPLVTIDPVPFELVIAQKKADIAEATAQVQADHDTIASAQADADAAQAEADLARVTQKRMASLSGTGDVSRQTLDKADDDLRRAEAARRRARRQSHAPGRWR